MLRYILFAFIGIVSFNSICAAQELRTVNRTATGNDVIHLNEAPGAGVAWIRNKQFDKGTIEFDVKGKDVLQQSFVGFAFHGVNDSTYDAIYFRPFNFQVPEAGRRSHSVQYISLPANDWELLREKYPGKYENEIDSSTDPNKWFHVKIVVTDDEAAAYVNGKRCLTVTLLGTQKTGMVGYWVGNGSGGDWKNLKID
ncbi:family 16 glycoside hydrolase [Chitinophaga polysaccharea]|uniref:family 16 glycoside hydrolase n=1 Tax=Chitinophaga polysaccharea TaxID=1293035 RepID=UPI00115A24F1|nr:family 16 glycoside hydrolase [Chitinophaga polysaccharea]